MYVWPKSMPTMKSGKSSAIDPILPCFNALCFDFWKIGSEEVDSQPREDSRFISIQSLDSLGLELTALLNVFFTDDTVRLMVSSAALKRD